jgi:hypothetical protein
MNQTSINKRFSEDIKDLATQSVNHDAALTQHVKLTKEAFAKHKVDMANLHFWNKVLAGCGIGLTFCIFILGVVVFS